MKYVAGAIVTRRIREGKKFGRNRSSKIRRQLDYMQMREHSYIETDDSQIYRGIKWNHPFNWDDGVEIVKKCLCTFIIVTYVLNIRANICKNRTKKKLLSVYLAMAWRFFVVVVRRRWIWWISLGSRICLFLLNGKFPIHPCSKYLCEVISITAN